MNNIRLVTRIHTFFISNTFISNARLKLKKNQAKTKQHADAELLLFENYVHSSSTLSSKDNRRYSKECAKKKYVYLNILNIQTIYEIYNVPQSNNGYMY